MVRDVLPEQEAGSREWPLLAARMQNIGESDGTQVLGVHLAPSRHGYLLEGGFALSPGGPPRGCDPLLADRKRWYSAGRNGRGDQLPGQGRWQFPRSWRSRPAPEWRIETRRGPGQVQRRLFRSSMNSESQPWRELRHWGASCAPLVRFGDRTGWSGGYVAALCIEIIDTHRKTEEVWLLVSPRHAAVGEGPGGPRTG